MDEEISSKCRAIYGHDLKYKENGLAEEGSLCNRMSGLEMNAGGSKQCPVTDLVLPVIFYRIVLIQCCTSCSHTKFYDVCQWMCLELTHVLMCEHEADINKDNKT